MRTSARVTVPLWSACAGVAIASESAVSRQKSCRLPAVVSDKLFAGLRVSNAASERKMCTGAVQREVKIARFARGQIDVDVKCWQRSASPATLAHTLTAPYRSSRLGCMWSHSMT
jgi:hypothetical protein